MILILLFHISKISVLKIWKFHFCLFFFFFFSFCWYLVIYILDSMFSVIRFVAIFPFLYVFLLRFPCCGKLLTVSDYIYFYYILMSCVIELYIMYYSLKKEVNVVRYAYAFFFYMIYLFLYIFISYDNWCYFFESI